MHLPSQFIVASFLLVALTGCMSATQPSSQPPPPVTASSAEGNAQADEPLMVADHLQIPWALAFLPSGDLLVTERPGTLLRVGKDRVSHSIDGVRHIGEGGLLGLALHPDFPKNHWIYLYLTTAQDDGVTNRVERYTYENDHLTDHTEIISGIPGAVYHDGGCLAFGPDGYLYITTGDATREANAQDTRSLAGKILRIRDDGSIPEDNPFGNAVYSYGHRNPQGLVWDDQGRLWSTEHGRSGVQSGFDELNLIEKGGNYGWPDYEGSETGSEVHLPALHSGPTTTWAPASAAYHDGSIFFGGLRGEALYEAVLPSSMSDQIQLKRHFDGIYGRIRAVTFGPDGFLYFTTSNTDGRGSKGENDDRIIKMDARIFSHD